MAALEDELTKLLNPTPFFKDPEDYSDDETRAKLVDHGNDDVEELHNIGASSLRKKNVTILGDFDNRYAGKRTSRKDLQDTDQYAVSSDDDADADDNDDSDMSEMEEASDEGSGSVDGSEDEKIAEFQNKMKLTSSQKKFSVGGDGEFPHYGDQNTEEETDSDLEGSDNDLEGSGSDLEGSDSDGDTEDKDIGGKINDEDDEEITSEEEEGIQKFSTAGSDDVAKGKAAKQQLGLWDSLLEGRIKLQKAVSIINQLPQSDTWTHFEENAEHFTEESLKTQKALKHLLHSLVHLQDVLFYQNAETRHLTAKTNNRTESSKKRAPSDSDEEIPSDSDEEMAGKPADDKPDVKVAKRKLKMEDYPEFLAKRHKEFHEYRDQTIQRWNDKTQLSGGKIKGKSFSAFEQSALKQINQILGDKERLIKRTQLKRSQYKILGKSESNEKSPTEVDEKREDRLISQDHLKDYDEEVFDDSDFYHQLLRELIEKKTSDISDPVALSRQWLEIQKLRGKTKRKVDNKASKGRKVRYDVHSKLVNFMAPMNTCDWSDEARDDLFKSLFGKRFASVSR